VTEGERTPLQRMLGARSVAVVGAYLWIADLALSHFVKNVLLNL